SNTLDQYESNFTSSLLTKLGNNRCLVIQKITKYKASLDFYSNNQLKKHFEDESPNMVWKQTGILKKYNGSSLFGLEDPIVQQAMQNISANNITCSPNDWSNLSVLELLFDRYI
ncbi:23795_t:CDS:1, partial [Gigaspora rosea]